MGLPQRDTDYHSYGEHLTWQDDIVPEPYDGMVVSEADYWRYYADWPDVTYEWHQGRLEAKGVSDWATILLFQWFIALIRYWLDSHAGGQLVNQEMGFVLNLAGQRSIRRPDTGIILPHNPHQLQLPDRSYPGVFDLCLEALSDSDPRQKARDQVVKYREYAQAGVPEYYILAGDLANCAFYRRDPQGFYQPLMPDAEGIMASVALPGLRWRQRDLVKQPSLEGLLTDPVYRDYVLPEFSRAREAQAAALVRADQEARRAEQAAQRAEQEAQRAEQEAQRADQEAQRANQEAARAALLTARLRQLGIDPS
ncbi:Uma2 family endonuclease [Halochromatium roseum]|uniref:Uma2 family endonuclease n=1 Tax=Halochromatium roseum TaxID=391920 RepID=UPI00191171C2|nr:Uma2 family endonuclease [Halochromatium roseum]MBK5939892.1 hypothetical protein [Halochromatium roseum]